ncbi:MAG: HEAT repeat domain-containing protein [Pirellulales bacterium]
MSDTPRPDVPPAFGAHEPYPAPPNRPAASGDDMLPPVEPPSARFIIQLFVVPAIIVLLVVGVWIGVTWLVRRTTMQPEDLIAGLETSSVARWQRASELADLLRNERFKEFRHDQKAADQLAAILDREVDAAEGGQKMDEQSVMLRYFLARALGEFEVDAGTESLLKAAKADRDPQEALVRRGALQAIAVRAYNLSQLDPPRALMDSSLEPTLYELSTDENPLVRSETAYALGQIGTPTALVQLEKMVVDPHADTRYNAALALAQHGNAAAIPTLAEMLDPAEMSSVREEPNDAAQFYKRSLIVTNALEKVEKLHREQPDADFAPVVEVLQAIITAKPVELEKARFHPTIVPRAKEVLLELQPKPH